MIDLRDLGGRRAFDELLRGVLDAADIALGYFGSRTLASERKSDGSPVTEADRRVEERLREVVAKTFPGARFWGEELGRDERDDAELRFIVDPIDGTRAFMRGLSTWSILVGLELRGRVVAGIAYLPAAGALFTGIEGHGAYENGRPLRVSSVSTLADALVCHGGLAQFTDDGRERLLPALARASFTQRGMGDFAGYATLLRGQADAVIDPAVQPYDIAAAFAIVREAGGKLTSLTGEETVMGPGSLASNGLVHDELLALIAAQS